MTVRAESGVVSFLIPKIVQNGNRGCFISHPQKFSYIRLLLKKHMLVESCAKDYNTLDGLVNGANGTFKDFTQTSSKSFIWMQFYNSKIGNKRRIKILHICKQFPIISKEWTPIKKNYRNINR
jgi:hypothetical protein